MLQCAAARNATDGRPNEPQQRGEQWNDEVHRQSRFDECEMETPGRNLQLHNEPEKMLTNQCHNAGKTGKVNRQDCP